MNIHPPISALATALMIGCLLNYVLKSCAENLNADPLHKLTILHRCIIHFDCMAGIISQSRDVAQRLDINALVIL